ncbi:MAG: FmdB family zinc ribbon protein [Burkholderiales bacterium]
MPIYEYRCTECGFQKEYLQKLSDPKLTVCPECGKETFSKMLTAAGFQLKGSGWYATDFKNTGKPKESGKDSGKGDTTTAAKPDSKGDTKTESKTESKTETKTESKPAASSGTGSTPAAS